MTIILNNNQINGSITVPMIGSCLCLGLYLNYEQFVKIESCVDKTFNIFINFGGKKRNVLLSRCVKCAWVYVSKSGLTHMSINCWESYGITLQESRDILINSLYE